mmetsp:Transcript_8468/g.29895  ORF Transcript_8468/g.29895 Transcript_8468/m.29895 type:complete len:261 (+) Transcript_8468:1560-2342(+)
MNLAFSTIDTMKNSLAMSSSSRSSTWTAQPRRSSFGNLRRNQPKRPFCIEDIEPVLSATIAMVLSISSPSADTSSSPYTSPVWRRRPNQAVLRYATKPRTPRDMFITWRFFRSLKPSMMAVNFRPGSFKCASAFSSVAAASFGIHCVASVLRPGSLGRNAGAIAPISARNAQCSTVRNEMPQQKKKRATIHESAEATTAGHLCTPKSRSVVRRSASSFAAPVSLSRWAWRRAYTAGSSFTSSLSFSSYAASHLTENAQRV